MEKFSDGELFVHEDGRIGAIKGELYPSKCAEAVVYLGVIGDDEMFVTYHNIRKLDYFETAYVNVVRFIRRVISAFIE